MGAGYGMVDWRPERCFRWERGCQGMGATPCLRLQRLLRRAKSTPARDKWQRLQPYYDLPARILGSKGIDWHCFALLCFAGLAVSSHPSPSSSDPNLNISTPYQERRRRANRQHALSSRSAVVVVPSARLGFTQQWLCFVEGWREGLRVILHCQHDSRCSLAVSCHRDVFDNRPSF